MKEIDEQRMWTQNLKMYIQNRDRDFPRGPVVKTSCFKCRGHKFGPWLGN